MYKRQLDVGLVTELMSRGGLDAVIRKHGAAMSTSLKLKLVLDTAKGLSYLHSCQPPIIHRDMKPSNVLVSADFTAKIADLGLSTFRAKSNNRQMTMNVGTPVYTAPEVLASDDYTETCDVYSFGVLMIEAVACEPVYSQPEFADMPTATILYRVVHQGLTPPIPEAFDPSIRQLISECFQSPALRPSFPEIVLRLQRLMLAYPPPAYNRAAGSNSDTDYSSGSSRSGSSRSGGFRSVSGNSSLSSSSSSLH